ncbi:hypothetical protein BH23ACT6_BH23ACT6_10900 [soil metagenome]
MTPAAQAPGGATPGCDGVGRCRSQDVRCKDREAGSATVLAVGLIAVMVTILVAMTLLGAAVSARQQAQLAADLGAVAGAQVLRQGGEATAVCDRVARFVQDNGADLDRCTVRSGGAAGERPDVVVGATVRPRLGPGWIARANARAGLVEP